MWMTCCKSLHAQLDERSSNLYIGSFGQVFYGLFTESDQSVMEVAVKTIKGNKLCSIPCVVGSKGKSVQ